MDVNVAGTDEVDGPVGTLGMDRWRRNRVAIALAGVACALTFAALAAVHLWGDRTWITALIEATPAVLYPMPIVLALGVALVARRWALVGVLAVVGALALILSAPPYRGATGGHSDHAVISLMSYNIAFAQRGFDDVLVALRSEEPDVLCLQEADHWPPLGHVPDRLRRALPDYHFAWQGQMLTASRFPIRKVEIVPLPDHPSERPMLVTYLEVGGATIPVANVHLVPAKWDLFRLRPRPLVETLTLVPRIRARQVETIAGWVADRETAIVAGDFNFQPFGPNVRRLQGLMTDSFASAGRGFGMTLTSEWPTKRIDYVWLRGLVATEARVVGTRASDHMPLIVRMSRRDGS